MLCEYRSDNQECLEAMKAHFERIFKNAQSADVNLNIKLIGDRPCMGKIDLKKIENLTKICREIIEDTLKIKVSTYSSSTDCNIPLSFGIPALCIGVYNGGGMHKREEWVEKATLHLGLEVGIKVAVSVLKEV